MRNFFVLCVTVALLYLGYEALQPAPVPPPPPPPRVTIAPAPTIAPKLYFHSALDAPAMSTRATTGTGYFSTDPNARVVGVSGYDAGGSLASGGPTYIVVPRGGTTAAPTATSPLAAAAAAAQAQQSNGVYSRRAEPVRATPLPTALAR